MTSLGATRISTAIPIDDLPLVGDLLRFRAQTQAESPAYSFLANGERVDTLTYSELDRRSRAIAALLQHWELAGQRALLLYSPGLDFIAAFFACLYAGVIAVPVQPPHRIRSGRSLSQLRAVAADAEVGAVLTTRKILEMMPDLSLEAPELRSVPWLATDQPDSDGSDSYKPLSADPSTTAFIQYTSGSTASPKGVLVSHKNLLHTLSCIHYCEENDKSSVSLSWLPVYHDMGLIEGVLEPVFGGYPAFLMAPASFLQRPRLWLEAISRYRVTNSGGPDFAYRLCVQRTTLEERRELDLSSWRVAYSGGEPVRSTTMNAFITAFGDCGFHWNAFYPVYGLAEATLVVSSGRQTHEPVFRQVVGNRLGGNRVSGPVQREDDPVELVGCGPPAPDSRVVIVNPETRTPCKPSEVGEIWVSSPSVTGGYWNRPQETQETFRAHLKKTGEGPFLRTGDLGFLWQNQLFITGRLKDLIIIRGRNHYPQDLETTVESCHPVIRPGCCAAFSLPIAHDERVAVMAEVRPRRQRQYSQDYWEDVIAAIRQALAEEHQLRLSAISLIAVGTIPKTSSGKLKRHACREGFLAGTLPVLKRWEMSSGFAQEGKIKDHQVA